MSDLKEIIDFLENTPIRVGDKVRIKKVHGWGDAKLWIVAWKFKDGTFSLRGLKNEEDEIERYTQEELVRLK